MQMLLDSSQSEFSDVSALFNSTSRSPMATMTAVSLQQALNLLGSDGQRLVQVTMTLKSLLT